MKENSIEEDIKIIEYNMKCIRNVMNNFEDKLCENMQIKTDEVSKIIYNILSDYKRVLKENEELLEVKVSTSAHNRILELEKENEELKNNTRKNENELEFDIDCDWIALQKMLDESEKSNEYISYKNEKWIKEKYCIPVQKIKDKIEELNRKIDKSIDNSKGGLDEEFIEKAGELLTQKRILQELLEKE